MYRNVVIVFQLLKKKLHNSSTGCSSCSTSPVMGNIGFLNHHLRVLMSDTHLGPSEGCLCPEDAPPPPRKHSHVQPCLPPTHRPFSLAHFPVSRALLRLTSSYSIAVVANFRDVTPLQCFQKPPVFLFPFL